MADLTRGQIRSEVILRAKKAFQEGVSASRFILDMRGRGLSYRRTDMLADWRSVNELERKADAFKYVRKDYYPTEKSMAQVEWMMAHEFMYKLKVQARVTPDVPITERFINISSDIPLTRGGVEAKAWEMIGEQSPDKRMQVEKILGWTAVQRVSE